MGAEFVTGLIPKIHTTQDEMQSYLETQIEDSKHEYGHGGYTGTLAEAQGVEFQEESFDSIDDAEAWLLDNTPKYGPIYVVTASYEAANFWVYGAICSS